MIRYEVGNHLDIDAVIELYQASTLGERRPIDNRDRMVKMIQNANLIVTAWDGDLLVGISRALSDFTYVTYLSDLAVRKSYQKQGIGKELTFEGVWGSYKSHAVSVPRSALGYMDSPKQILSGQSR